MVQSLLQPPEILKFENVEYRVPPTLGLNHSFFMPTLNTDVAFKAVTKHYSQHGYKLVWAERIEQDQLGIRVWRML
jgi:hypothetical protein